MLFLSEKNGEFRRIGAFFLKEASSKIKPAYIAWVVWKGKLLKVKVYMSMCICAECDGGPWHIGGTQLKGKKGKEEEK